MGYSVYNLRRIRRRTNRRSIIKGQGFISFLRRKARQVRDYAKRKLPSVAESLKTVGKRHWDELRSGGIPTDVEELKKRGRRLAGDALAATRSALTGSGSYNRISRMRPYRYRPPIRRSRY